MKNLLLIQPKSFLKQIYPEALWKVNSSENELFLTFDDGPIPELTEWVLDTLKEHHAKATFFCVGANILKNPQLFERIIAEGHLVANHTMHHIKGFKSTVANYLSEVKNCEELTKTKLFRPPYGQLKPSQYKALLNEGYKVVMWDVISYDYEKITPQQCLNNVLKHSKTGSIVLFHDNVKACENLKYTLPLFLKHFANLQFKFKSLNRA